MSARVKDMRPAGLRDEYLDTLLPAQAALAGAVLGPREVQAVYPPARGHRRRIPPSGGVPGRRVR